MGEIAWKEQIDAWKSIMDQEEPSMKDELKQITKSLIVEQYKRARFYVHSIHYLGIFIYSLIDLALWDHEGGGSAITFPHFLRLGTRRGSHMEIKILTWGSETFLTGENTPV